MPEIQDQNFDNLAERFRKNIYTTPKGKIRMHILWRDLHETIPLLAQGKLQVLDAGAGQGNLALRLAQQGHALTLCDISGKMLDQARRHFTEQAPAANVRFLHSSVQALAQQNTQPFDLVLFHAVLEWLAQPEQTLRQLYAQLQPGGYLSLMFYSRTGLIYQNLTNGNFDLILEEQLAGDGKSLTPINPLLPEEVFSWLAELGAVIDVHSGVRVFYDGMTRARRREVDETTLLELEARFSRLEPYRSLARYVHVVCHKPTC